MEIFRLFGSIFVDNEAANQSISKTEEKAEGLGNKFLKGVGTAAKWGIAIGGAAIAGATALGGLAMKAAETTDRIDKLSAKTGLSKQAFQEWDYVLGQNGVNIEVMKNGMKTLTNFMDQAAQGSEKVISKFDDLGVKLFDTSGQLRAQEDVMRDTLKALADLPNGAEKSAKAVELFGKAGLELMPMLNNGSESIEELTQRAHDLGLVMSDEAVNAGVLLGDTMDNVKKTFGAIATKVGVEVMPIVQSALEWVLAAMPTVQVVMGGVFNFIGTMIQGVVNFVNNLLMPALQSFFDDTGDKTVTFIAVMQALWDYIQPLLNDLKELFGTVLGAIQQYWKENGEAIKKYVQSVFNIIRILVETALGMIRGIIQIITGLIKGDWEAVWNGIKTYVESVMNGIAEILPNLLEAVRNAFILAKNAFKNAGKAVFDAVWEGMKEIWERLTNWVNDKVSWLTEKLAFWRSSKAEMSDGGGGYDGSHANGLAYVPFDGYIAQLHQGERVLTKKENEEYSKGSGASIVINQHIYTKVEDERLVQREAERRFSEQVEKLKR